MDLYDKILNKEDIESIIELIKEDKKNNTSFIFL